MVPLNYNFTNSENLECTQSLWVLDLKNYITTHTNNLNVYFASLLPAIPGPVLWLLPFKKCYFSLASINAAIFLFQAAAFHGPPQRTISVFIFYVPGVRYGRRLCCVAHLCSIFCARLFTQYIHRN